MYTIGETVIINYHNSKQVGIIVDSHFKKSTGRTYDVMTEKGSVYTYTPIDKMKLNQYIDSALTETLVKSGKIKTNLNVNWLGNYAKGIIPITMWNAIEAKTIDYSIFTDEYHEQESEENIENLS